MTGQPAGRPVPVELANFAVQVTDVDNACCVQFCAFRVAVEDPPGATAGGANVSDVICTIVVPPQAAGRTGAAAPACPGPTSSPAATIGIAARDFQRRMALLLAKTVRCIDACRISRPNQLPPHAAHERG